MLIFSHQNYSIILKQLCGSFKILVLLLLLQACGGGGSSPSAANTSASTNSDNRNTPISNTPTIGGFVVKGPVQNASVKLLAVALNGTTSQLETTLTDSNGAYQFHSAPAAGATIMIEATGGQYSDEVTGHTEILDTPLRAASVWSGQAMSVSVSAYSELVVRALEQYTPTTGNPTLTKSLNTSVPSADKLTHRALSTSILSINARSQGIDWSAEIVRGLNQALSQQLGVSDVLSFTPVDARQISDINRVAVNDSTMALLNGTVAALRQTQGSSPQTNSLASALAGLYTLFVSDPLNDQMNAAFIGAYTQFIDSTALDNHDKEALKLKLFTPLSGDNLPTLNQMMPSGQASGAATSIMPDNRFHMVPQGDLSFSPLMRTTFNERGALVAYTPAENDTYALIYTASVGEVFGDGELGIGRWHGGVVAQAEKQDDAFVHLRYSHTLANEPGWAYAVVRPLSWQPSCGKQTLQLAQATQSTSPIKGISHDSKLVIQYQTHLFYVAYDIGLILPNDQVIRLQSPGGLDQPMMGAVKETDNHFHALPDIDTTLHAEGIGRLTLQGIVGGVIGNKVGMTISIQSTVNHAMIDANTSPPESVIALAFTPKRYGFDTLGCGF